MSRAQANVDVFRAIADPTRRAILDRLRDEPAPVNSLAREFAESRQAISKHLHFVRALGREPGDFADYAQDSVATGVWGGEK